MTLPIPPGQIPRESFVALQQAFEALQAQGLSDAAITAIVNDAEFRAAVFTGRRGSLAARPAAAAFGQGTYFAEDDNGGQLYVSNGSSWTKAAPGGGDASGLELAYAENQSGTVAVPQNITATQVNAPVDVTGLIISVPASARPVWLLHEGIYTHSVAGGLITVRFTEIPNGVDTPVNGSFTFASPGGSSFQNQHAHKRIGPTLRARQWKVQMENNTAGTATVYPLAGQPCFFTAQAR